MFVRFCISTFLLSLLFFTGVQGLYAQAVTLDDLSVKSQGANVVLEWALTDESGISEFRIYRDFNSENNFEYVTTIFADGSLSYFYMDDDIFKDAAKLITYELQVVKNGKVHKFYTTLSHNPTSIQRTWVVLSLCFGSFNLFTIGYMLFTILGKAV